ncbi:MAG: 30S ribosomal protein S5 [Candidatus Omnitrophica bacterium CG1_02_44_16]|nr:MAG: 30S ribosomal protein S5 [Candidatus Omnitrophica bacterium CG1_02_44_16]PIY82809.1 MAG: 30S ribosomal protein S5 [Candidatus Omnitrophica bacterium CG_4_10_14_0_8_um_filter_44_12]PIZ84056.1 MAG: 30S ribosomal protein S5 [Candidatus Omnitrophica bacterium CG_4_10_14_0_2_um_filter_44_9]
MVERIFGSESKEAIEKVVKINRVAKVTKGGKKLSFSALVVVGNTKGRVGISLGKANEVADAIRKGISQAKRNMMTVPMVGTTIPYDVMGKFGSARVMLKPAVEGTGIIASGPVRAVCEAAGIKDILTKCITSNNPLNVILATLQGFKQMNTDLEIFDLRNEPRSEQNEVAKDANN